MNGREFLGTIVKLEKINVCPEFEEFLIYLYDVTPERTEKAYQYQINKYFSPEEKSKIQKRSDNSAGKYQKSENNRDSRYINYNYNKGPLHYFKRDRNNNNNRNFK